VFELRLEDGAVKGCVDEMGKLIAFGRRMPFSCLDRGLKAVRQGKVYLVVDLAQSLSDWLAVLARLSAEVADQATLRIWAFFRKQITMSNHFSKRGKRRNRVVSERAHVLIDHREVTVEEFQTERIFGGEVVGERPLRYVRSANDVAYTGSAIPAFEHNLEARLQEFFAVGRFWHD
jgi:hypothetical protein